MLHPSILTTYWLRVLAVCNDLPYPDVHCNLPPVLRAAANSQARLGWGRLMHGRLTRYWAHAIDYLHPHLAMSGTQIMTQFLEAVWTYVLTTWTTWNKHLHNDTGHLSLPNYQQAVRTLYERGAQLPLVVQAPLF